MNVLEKNINEAIDIIKKNFPDDGCQSLIAALNVVINQARVSLVKDTPIDFDALYDELSTHCKHTSCASCNNKGGLDQCFLYFLKSKNLCAPTEQKTKCAVCGETKHTPLRRDDMGGYVCLSCIDAELSNRTAKRELPVKTKWVMKLEVHQTVLDLSGVSYVITTYDEPKEHLKKYYDKITEVDYAEIPKGSIIELESVSDGCRRYRVFSEFKNGYLNCYYEGGKGCTYPWEMSRFIRVVEWGNDGE